MLHCLLQCCQIDTSQLPSPNLYEFRVPTSIHRCRLLFNHHLSTIMFSVTIFYVSVCIWVLGFWFLWFSSSLWTDFARKAGLFDLHSLGLFRCSIKHTRTVRIEYSIGVPCVCLLMLPFKSLYLWSIINTQFGDLSYCPVTWTLIMKGTANFVLLTAFDLVLGTSCYGRQTWCLNNVMPLAVTEDQFFDTKQLYDL